jgi:hypothetical protein
MRFYTRQHAHYCGIDFHARSLYLCILDQQGRPWSIASSPVTERSFELQRFVTV